MRLLLGREAARYRTSSPTTKRSGSSHATRAPSDVTCVNRTVVITK